MTSLSLFALLLSNTVCLYAQSLQLHDSLDFYVPNVSYTIVHEDSSSLKQAMGLDQKLFQPKGHEQYFTTYGLEQELWLRTSLTNQSQQSKWYFVFDNPLVDEINVYLLVDGKILKEQRFGDRFKFSEKPLATRPLVLPVELANGQTYEVYFNVDTDGRKTNPVLLIMTPDRFNQWELVKRNELSLLYGFLSFLAIITLFLSWIFKDLVFRWLGVFFFSILCIYISTGGLAGQYIWPEHPGIGQKMPGVLVYISLFFAIGFCRAFLAETVSRLVIDKIFYATMAMMLFLAALAFADGWILYAVIWLMYKMLALGYFLILATVIYSLFKRQSASLLLMLGIVVCIIAFVLLERTDERAGHVFNNGGSIFSFALGCLFMAFASIDRLRILKEYEKDRQLYTERERIARDLHDNIGTQLTSLSLGITQAGKDVQLDPEKMKALQEHANATLIDLRDTIWVITKNSVTLEQLRDKVESMLWRMQKEQETPQFLLQIEPSNLDQKLSPDQAMNLFRIVQEAVNNSLKHSQAKKITVKISQEKNLFCLTIEDDGVGFEATAAIGKESYGLGNMRKRAEQMLAELNVLSGENLGTTVKVSFHL